MCRLFYQLVCAVLFLASLSTVVPAQTTTYTYTGNPFTGFSNTACPPICRITGSFSVAQPLPQNSTVSLSTPSSFSFTDGFDTITGGANTCGPDGQGACFTLNGTTNAQGQIVSWWLDISIGANPSTSVVFYVIGGNYFGPENNGDQIPLISSLVGLRQ